MNGDSANRTPEKCNRYCADWPACRCGVASFKEDAADLAQSRVTSKDRSPDNIKPPYDVALPKITAEIWESYQDEEFIDDSPRWGWTCAAVDFACEIVRPAVWAAMERLTRELQDETDTAHMWEKAARRYRAALETVLDEACWPDTPAFKAARKAARKLLSDEPPAPETSERQDAREDRAYCDGAQQALAIAAQSWPAAEKWLREGCGNRRAAASAVLTTIEPAPTAVRLTFDAGRMVPILEWTRMPSGAYVVLAGTPDNFDSLWFDREGHHPKSELVFAQLIPQPSPEATEAMMARARSAQKAGDPS